MIPIRRALLALWLTTATSSTWAQAPGSFGDGGQTQVSAMMMFVGNNQKVYILDKAEQNAAQINGHPAWGARWDINTHQVDLMDVKTNTFCASGMHLPNGSWVTFGGNGAVGPGGNIGSQVYPNGASAEFDQTIQDFDGTKSIRVLNPCDDTANFADPSCQWFDNATFLSMQKSRWYSAAEPLGDGSVVILGGFVNGGYVNRNFPNVDPQFEGGAAECTYEMYPPNGQTAQTVQFLIKTSGLNSYAHTYLMPSGKMFVQANVSTMLWDVQNNQETPLPDMPNGVVRVYPGSGGVAMLPLTPANNYNPTILFCGGQNMPADDWGNYSYPAVDTWNIPASNDCQRITPEPTDGSTPQYQQDDNMLETRTMGQFVILPDGTLLMINGGNNGTAGYSDQTNTTPKGGNPFGFSLASGPVGTPAIYNPNAASGSRWSNKGLSTSQIPRLYHSSAILLPDTSVLVAGSNPNVDVNLTAPFPTTYKAEIFYPPYFSASTRPAPSGIPTTLSYGGNSFDITIPASSYSGLANDAADSIIVAVVRPGWTTHGMNMGQRFLQLNNTYTVNSDGSISIHTAQMPPNANIFQPGPAYVHVTINGVPSNGSYVLVGNGQIGQQPTAGASSLPANVRADGVKGTADGSTTSSGGGSSGGDSGSKPKGAGSSIRTGVVVGAVVGAVAVLGLIGTVLAIFIVRRRRSTAAATKPISQRSTAPYQTVMSDSSVGGARGMTAGVVNGAGYRGYYGNQPMASTSGLLSGGAATGVVGGGINGVTRNSDSESLLPLQDNFSRVSLPQGAQFPSQDMYGSGIDQSMDYDPYSSKEMSSRHGY